jgi:hypothetical protein
VELAVEVRASSLILYKELVEFCELMLTRPELSAENGHLRRRLDHYYSRLEHWQARLSAAQPDTPRYEEVRVALDNLR